MNLHDDPKMQDLYNRMKAHFELDMGPGSLSEERFLEIYESGQQAWKKIEEDERRRDWLESEVERLKHRVDELETALREKH